MKKLKRVLEKVLNKFGYYRCDMPEGTIVSEAEILEIFRTYGSNEMFVRFLRDTCERDKNLYFQADTDVDRNTIRGAYRRTLYFISLIKKANDKRK